MHYWLLTVLVLYNWLLTVLYADEDGYVDVKIPKKQRPPLSLPPMPPGLSPEKVRKN